jgi:hypothetical protein
MGARRQSKSDGRIADKAAVYTNFSVVDGAARDGDLPCLHGFLLAGAQRKQKADAEQNEKARQNPSVS